MAGSRRDDVYSELYLRKSGVHFDFNVVDTTVRRGLGLCFYAVLGLLAIVTFALVKEDLLQGRVLVYARILQGLTVIYCALVLIKYLYYVRVRSRLRRDPLPIMAEAYALVELDARVAVFSRYLPSFLLRTKKAVVFKECGTQKPRFFLSAATVKLPDLNDGQLVRVFIDRRQPRIYSVDDASALQTQSARVKSRVFNLGISGPAGVQSSEGMNRTDGEAL
ncbi:MAG TPA: hypothetical protein IAB18_00145 [Candidatus Avisuccinivibrio pullicola]|nr:hypothetical protein [Candidatus Avisuccinivibrio pullicola]